MPILANMEPIERAIKAAGGVSALASDLDVKPPTVSQWRHGQRPVPPRLALSIEAEFGISRHELRPDVFGPPSEVDRAA